MTWAIESMNEEVFLIEKTYKKLIKDNFTAEQKAKIVLIAREALRYINVVPIKRVELEGFLLDIFKVI